MRTIILVRLRVKRDILPEKRVGADDSDSAEPILCPDNFVTEGITIQIDMEKITVPKWNKYNECIPSLNEHRWKKKTCTRSEICFRFHFSYLNVSRTLLCCYFSLTTVPSHRE